MAAKKKKVAKASKAKPVSSDLEALLGRLLEKKLAFEARAAGRPVVRDFPAVPPEWTDTASEAHWIPSAETRAEIARLMKAAVKQTERAKTATWKKVGKLLPPALAEIVGKASWAWTTVPSPEVVAVAMALIRHSAQPGADAARIQRELERILPDLPMLCLGWVVEQQTYLDALEALDYVPDPSGQLRHLRDYLSDS